MKKIALIICLVVFGISKAQDKNPKFEKFGDLVKATYFYDNGKIKQQGYFKNKKLTGTWVSYDEKGVKTAIAHYSEGKKEGKWFIWSYNGVKEVNYNNSKIVSVEQWKGNSENNIAAK